MANGNQGSPGQRPPKPAGGSKPGRGETPKPGLVKRTREQVYMEYAWLLALVDADETGTLRAVFDWAVKKYVDNARRDVPLAQPFTEAELEGEIRKTEWFKRRDSIIGQAEIDRARNPEDYRRSVADRRADIAELADRYGIVISDEQLDDLAEQARLNGWDGDQTRRSLEPFLIGTLAGEGDLMGTAGDYETQLLNWANQNGLRLSRQAASKYIANMTLGKQTLRDVQADIRKTYMAGMFPAWEDKINAGFDPSDLFEPYRDAAVRLLELGENGIGFDDPLMRRATQYLGADGKPSQIPLYQFEQEVRKDPRWQYTDNAYETYANVGTDLLRMFGFR